MQRATLVCCTVPSAPPSNIHATMVDNTTMYLTWEPPPAQHLNGPLRGYKVKYTDVIFVYSNHLLWGIFPKSEYFSFQNIGDVTGNVCTVSAALATNNEVIRLNLASAS